MPASDLSSSVSCWNRLVGLIQAFNRSHLALICLITGCIANCLIPVQSFAADVPSGERIYSQQCAKCHGAKGEGNDEFYPHPLIGDRSLQELTQYVEKTMPEDEPEKCVGEDARAVSAYIYDKFYSRVAQARNKPVRIELSRLTVRQYRNALADLLSDDDSVQRWNSERGLRGQYYKSRRFRGDGVIERLDPSIEFQFGEASPAAGKIEPEEFGIRWQGAVVAPDTGEYEFNLRTENGARLWVNNNERPLIDAWVKSGNDVNHRESIFLLGGRAYPLRVEFFKSKEAKEKNASIVLEWKLPHRPAEPIPNRFLLPARVSETYVARTSFPPDDRSVGYERGTSISKAWDQATTDEAIEVAGYVVDHLEELTGARPDSESARSRCFAFCKRFAERAFRRPLTDEQEEFFIKSRFAEGVPVEVAVKHVVVLALKSPRFLYRELATEGDAYAVASRLSFGLWDSIPDGELLARAAAGELHTKEQIVAQAQRMLNDPRTRSKLHEFLLQWLKMDHVPDMSKDPVRYPEFTPEIASDLRTSLELFLEDVAWSDSGDFRQLLLDERLFLNGRLGRFYNVDLPADASFQKVSLDPTQRAGVLSHPYLMAGFAYTASSSPIHRGVFVARSILGRSLRQPPEAVAPLIADLHPDLTTRERVALQTKPEACQSCHATVNPLGFSLENFDAVGRFRHEEKGRPVDSTGAYRTRQGELVRFAGVRDLANFLANSPETHSAFIEQLFHYMVKQPIRAYQPDSIAALKQSFAKHDFNLRRLMVEIMASSALESP